MSDPQAPITVNANSLPSVLQTIIGSAAGMLGGFLVGRGWITADQIPQVAGVLMAIGGAAWTAYQAWRNHKKLVITADAAPARVANVTK
jgi:uncharacterized membrane protein YebE (DUF533 family)